jgi:hypothetical protein
VNATGGRVLVQIEDLVMLKTLGFTPGQVTAMLVAQHAALGLAEIAARGRQVRGRRPTSGRFDVGPLNT